MLLTSAGRGMMASRPAAPVLPDHGQQSKHWQRQANNIFIVSSKTTAKAAEHMPESHTVPASRSLISIKGQSILRSGISAPDQPSFDAFVQLV